MSLVFSPPTPASGTNSGRWPVNSRGIIGGVVILVILAIQRWELAGLAQWREDQTTNLWLGLQIWRGQYLPPVGLINSLGSPNPNGMNWLGFLLSALPSLRAASLALGLVQLALLARLCSLLFGKNPALFWATLLVSGSCLQVVLTGVEFWAQWTLSLINLLFFIELVKLQKGARPFWPAFIIANCIMVAPALYLAGVLNSAGYVALLALVLWQHPANCRDLLGRLWQKCLWALMFALHGTLVWLPYAYRVGFSGVTGLSRPYLQRLRESGLTLIDFPVTIYRLLPQGMENMTQITPDLMSPHFYLALRFSHYAICALLLGSLLWLLWKRQFSPAMLFLIFTLFLCVLSPLVGGFAWGLGERLDQVTQFLPLLLVAAFGALPQSRRLHAPLLGLALLFAGVHLDLSQKLHAGLSNYRGPKLGEADLPLDDRRHAIDFIASDWLALPGHATLSAKVPIFYSFGDSALYHEPEVAMWAGIINRFGAILSNWYPDAPYTIGRGYDWELMRRWHLENQDEGKAQQERKWDGHRYTLSMVGLPPPSYLPASVRHYEFGRVRVSVLDAP